jgi:hypothetical protein
MTTTATQRKAWEIRMPWKEWAPYADTPIWGVKAAQLSGSNGIYELADASGKVIYAGYAGSRARFGLRGKLKDHFSDLETNPEIAGKAHFFRYEVTSSYLSRWIEVIGRHSQAGAIPTGNIYAKDYPRRMPNFGPGPAP